MGHSITCKNCGHIYYGQATNGGGSTRDALSCGQCTRKFDDSEIDEILNKYYYNKE